jgi:SAM-dependent methyltransferase
MKSSPGSAHRLKPEPFDAEIGNLLSGTSPLRIESQLERLYANRFPLPERAEKGRLWETLYESFFCRYVPRDGTVLDLGAGYCDFINQVRAARRIAVDLNPETRQAAMVGIEVHLLPLDRLGDAIAPGSIDLAFASNVFEHLRSPDELLNVLAAVMYVLRPGGRLVILQPNVRLVGGRFWDFFDHTLPLTEKGMEEALGVSGFEVTECRPRFLPYTTKSRVPQWPWIVRLYLALTPAHWLFGKQMLLVARRPG